MRDENGDEYQYYPEHHDRQSEEVKHFVFRVEQYSEKHFAQEEKYDQKHCKPLEDCPPELLEKAKEIFG